MPKTQKSHMRELIESASEDGRITFPKIRSLPWALQYQVKCQSIVSESFLVHVFLDHAMEDGIVPTIVHASLDTAILIHVPDVR